MLGKNQGKTRRPRRREARNLADKSRPDEDHGGPSGSLLMVSHSVIPPKIGSDLSTIRFADAVEPSKVEVVLRCELIPLPNPTLPKHIGPSRLSVPAVHIAHMFHHQTSLFHR